MHNWVETNQSRIWKTVLLLVVLFTVRLFALKQDFAHLQEVLEKYGTLGLFISITIYALLGATPVPSNLSHFFSPRAMDRSSPSSLQLSVTLWPP